MRKTLFFIMLLWSIVTFAQIPSYYNDVNLTLSGSALKTELSNKIIVTHVTDLAYTPGVWDALRQTDLDASNTNNVVLIYGWNNSDGDITNDRTRDKTLQDSGSGATFVWNREHVYPKSLANPALVTGSPGAGTDAHNLRPADRSRNTSRSNRKFADGSGTASYITPSGDWYPGDEWKGDVARMMMYMYLRYGNQTLPTNVGVGTTVASDPNMILLFLEWNAEDPVSDLEKQRNPVLETLQGNRNPFIDNPAFATQIWGGPQAEDLFNGGSDTQAPTVPTNLTSSNTTSNSTLLSWTASTDDTAVTGYDVYRNATFVGSSASTSYTATGLSSNTTYSFYVIAKDAAGNQSAASTSINVTTSSGSGGGGATDLLISEYVEGSSNNKALEIANFTGSPVDLSSYDLRKATNGSGSFGSTYQLSGTLADGDVFVIANSSAVSAVTSVADVTTGSGIVTFNGNDAIGLFKNGTLIDAIGNPNSSANFAQNTTLRRISSVNSPNSTYTVSEWDSFSTDTFDGLGSHTMDGGTQGDTEAPTAPTSLSASSITETTLSLSWNASTDNVGVTEYEVFQGGSLIGTSTNTSFNVTGLTVVTSYSFTVQAKDAAGNISGNSNTANATTVDLTAPSTPTSLASSNVTETSVDLSWSAASDNVAVASYDVYQDASFIANTSTTSYSVSGLSAGTSYDFYVVAKDAAGNQSGNSNTETITTNTSNPGGGSELFLSEYIEGSSNNKALEIANFTGSSVDLSAYDLRKDTNGGGSWGSVYALSGTLSNGDVFVIANSSAVSAITSVADVTTGSGIVTFNGNDAIGLFKNGTLIDVIGNFGNSSVFAQNETLRRKSSVSSPNTTYTTSEWDFYTQDTFNGLGSHTVDGAGPTSTVLIESFFETGWDGWIDGGGDAARYSGSRSYEGSYSIRIRDNSSTASSMTTSTFDLTGYDTIETTFYFYVYSMENGEDFWFRYDDGSGWETVETWVSGTNMFNNNFYSATVTMDASSYNFVSNGRFRFQCDASGNADQIYIDQVTITGISSGGSRAMAPSNKLDLVKSLNTDIDAFTMYPNPVDGNILNIQLDNEEDTKTDYRIVSLLGHVLQAGTVNESQIQLQNLSKGVYFLELILEDEKLVKKFIKK
jgi:endonuclease I/chitodextrinase